MTRDFLARYLTVAPAALALERATECRILSELELSLPLLDLGCGDGLFGSVFYERPTAIGIDRDHGALRRARRFYRGLAAGDGRALPFADGAFATVLANSVLEHVVGLDAVLAEVWRVLSDAGRLVVTVPTESYQRHFAYSRLARALGLDGVAGMYERAVNRAFRHREVHEPAAWADRLQHAGFAIDQVKGYLSASTIAIDDLLYPSAAISRLWERLLGHYFLLPSLRRATAPLLARVLRSPYADPRDVAGYILIVATRPFTASSTQRG